MLEKTYYCFIVRPWTQNVTRSLLKQPKLYLWDWSSVQDKGARLENFVASHLLKTVHFWNDCGFGDYGLYFVRDKEKREVDFLVTKNKQLWFLVEAKSANNSRINPALFNFQKQIGAQHAFQVSFDMPYTDINCFTYTVPIKVSVLTLLSQLI